jgi:hypothetical protein
VKFKWEILGFKAVNWSEKLIEIQPFGCEGKGKQTQLIVVSGDWGEFVGDVEMVKKDSEA